MCISFSKIKWNSCVCLRVGATCTTKNRAMPCASGKEMKLSLILYESTFVSMADWLHRGNIPRVNHITFSLPSPALLTERFLRSVDGPIHSWKVGFALHLFIIIKTDGKTVKAINLIKTPLSTLLLHINEIHAGVLYREVNWWGKPHSFSFVNEPGYLMLLLSIIFNHFTCKNNTFYAYPRIHNSVASFMSAVIWVYISYMNHHNIFWLYDWLH